MSTPTTPLRFASPNLRHIPGPYFLHDTPHTLYVSDSDLDDELVAKCTGKLFAKAPMLLDAIERAMAALHPGEGENHAMARARGFRILKQAMDELVEG